MKLIGITGGIGAGKSEILKYVGIHYKCEIYLADDVAAILRRPGHEEYEELVALCGESILNPDKTINNSAMSARIFKDKDLLNKVNALIHPAVRKYLEEKIDTARGRGDVELFFIEAALLVETGYKDILDEMWYVYAGEDQRATRLREERGYTPGHIAEVMSRQLSEEAFRQACDFVIDNSGTLEESYGQIDEHLAGFTRIDMQERRTDS